MSPIGLAFAVALLAMLWLTRRGQSDRAWGYALAAIWLLNELCVYVLGPDLRLLTGLWTDFALALAALYAFTFARGRWWTVALFVTWAAQIFVHLDLDADMPTMGLWLNVLCGAQIALVCSDRITDAIAAWVKRECRSHGRVALASRHLTCALRGPDCRSAALRGDRRKAKT